MQKRLSLLKVFLRAMWVLYFALALAACVDSSDDDTSQSPSATPPVGDPDATPTPGVPDSPTPLETTPTPLPSTPLETTPTPNQSNATPTPLEGKPTPEEPGATPTTPPEGTPTPRPPVLDVDQDGFTEEDGDCNDRNDSVYPGAVDHPYDGIDQDCDGHDVTDVDNDGYDSERAGDQGSGPFDCNDDAPDIHPGAPETAYDGIDQDCDGSDLRDVDGDGFEAQRVGGEDCDDDDPYTHPGASELGDGKDNNCDGQVDDGLDTHDDDGDGYSELQGDCRDDDPEIYPSCLEVAYDGIDQDCDGKDLTDKDGDGFDGEPAGGEDCDDEDSEVHPKASETCNGVDDDCDGNVDAGLTSTCYRDADGDGHGNAEASIEACACPEGYLEDATDCSDTNDTIHPGAAEVCNGRDDNCDGETDEGVGRLYYQDADGDGFGDENVTSQACNAPAGFVSNALDCNDGNEAVYPGAVEVCNTVDENCDGKADEGVSTTYYQDTDGDGYGNPSAVARACAAPQGYVEDGSDCLDTEASIHPGATETCNGVDDDCDTLADEGLSETYYLDADGDTYGGTDITLTTCQVPSGFVEDNTDCDDHNATINPGAVEILNGADDDCDGEADNDLRYASCKELLLSNPALPDGSYFIDPDMGGPVSPFQVYCDMTTDGGGWTKVLYFSSSRALTTGSVTPEVLGQQLYGTGKLADNIINLIMTGEKEMLAVYPSDPSLWLVATWGREWTFDENRMSEDYAGYCQDMEGGGLLRRWDGTYDYANYRNNGSYQTSYCWKFGWTSGGDGGIDLQNDGRGESNASTRNVAQTAFIMFVRDGTFASSCQELLETSPATPSGYYTVDPDGREGALPPVNVYCDMEHDGGGWTLVARASDTNGAGGDYEYRAKVGDHSLLNADYSYGMPDADQYTLALDRVLPPSADHIELQYFCYDARSLEDTFYWSKVNQLEVSVLLEGLDEANPDFLLSGQDVENRDGDRTTNSYFAFFGREWEGDARCGNGYAGQSGIKFNCSQSGQGVLTPPSVWYLTHYGSENYTEVNSCGHNAGPVMPYYVGEVRFR